MDFRIYIQAVNNFPISDWATDAYIGFKQKGAEIVLFEEIDEVPVRRNNIVVAHIEDTIKYFNKLGIPTPIALNIPDSLKKYAGREIGATTMGEFKKMNKFPIFVKPNRTAKEFRGQVLEKREYLLDYANIEDDMPVFYSEFVDFISEYRCYVIDGELKGIYHYLGGIRVFPDVRVIDSAISDYKNSPAGYTIDFGITSDGRTLLIECNDGWSIGNYGLDDKTYSRLLSKRWLEIIKNN